MKFFITSLALLFSFSCFALEEDTSHGENSVLIEESNFEQLSQQMKKDSLGLVLMLHAEFCPYCALMENEILSPMIKSGDYDKRVFIRKLQIDESWDIKDFSGKIIKPSELSSRFDASLTPTLVFLDYQGSEKAQKMIGINTVELFSAYLDNEIDKLVKNIKKGSD